MTAKETFAEAAMRHKGDCFKQNAYTLGVLSQGGLYYDFLTRHLHYDNFSIPFSQIDREVLEFMRDMLIKKGGDPPPLPEEKANSSGLSFTKKII